MKADIFVKSFFLVLTGLLVLANISLSAPNQPTITVPAASGSAYNQKPWVKISASDATYNINDCHIQIDDTSSAFGSIVYDNWASRDGTEVQFSSLGTATSITIIHKVQTLLSVGTYYMRVMVWNDDVVDANRASSWSATRTFTINSEAWTDPTITAGTTLIKAAHFNEIRTAVEGWRTFRVLSAGTYSNLPVSSGDMIKAQDVADLRTNLSSAYNNAAGSNPTFTDSTITPGTTLIRKIHIDELRQELKIN